jgi:hypothetical protein
VFHDPQIAATAALKHRSTGSLPLCLSVFPFKHMEQQQQQVEEVLEVTTTTTEKGEAEEDVSTTIYGLDVSGKIISSTPVPTTTVATGTTSTTTTFANKLDKLQPFK